MTEALLLDEEGRLAALDRYAVLDSAPEEPFENIVNLVRTVLDVPIATVTLVARERQWFKAQRGLDGQETPRDISFCTHTIQQRAPLIVSDTFADPRFAGNPFVIGSPHLRAYAGVPLRTPEGYNIGALCAMDTKPHTFSETQLDMLGKFADLVMNELELRQIAQSDQLTGTLTRRAFLEGAAKEIERYKRYGRPSTLVLFDVDHFKAVNDAHGHPGGDMVLRAIADVCAPMMRPSDLLGRVGGEEFGLLLPEADGGNGLDAAERFRAAIHAAAFPLACGASLRITASFGIAPLTARITTPEAWLAAADAPLYAAKHGGRNQCRLTEDGDADAD